MATVLGLELRHGFGQLTQLPLNTLHRGIRGLPGLNHFLLKTLNGPHHRLESITERGASLLIRLLRPSHHLWWASSALIVAVPQIGVGTRHKLIPPNALYFFHSFRRGGTIFGGMSG